MFTSPEQFAAATKTLFELQMTTFNTLASKAVQGVEQVVALNMAAAKDSIEGTLQASKEPSKAMENAKAGVAGAIAYTEDLKEVIEGIHKEFEEAADAHMKEAKNTLSALIYDVTQNVKPGSPNAVAIVKAAIDNAFVGYEQVTTATRKAKAQVEEQIAKASEQVTKTKPRSKKS